jgi:DNA-binding CsgD family transcriptional regulator
LEEKQLSAFQSRKKLTDREYDVLSAISEGLSNKQITRRLNITESTVKHHVGKLFDKLGASSRLELVSFARYHRILELPQASGLGFSLTNDQKHLILRAINGQLRDEDVEPARRLADIIALQRERHVRKTA